MTAPTLLEINAPTLLEIDATQQTLEITSSRDAVSIQGRSIETGTPTDGEVLTYSTSASEWIYQTVTENVDDRVAALIQDSAGGGLTWTYDDSAGTLTPAYVGDSTLVTTGALNSGSITSGFGAIDVGSSNIDGGTITADTAFVGNLTGNASGTAATVTGATQAAITTAANLVTVGALDSGSITSGFGTVNIGSSALTAGAGSFTTISGSTSLALATGATVTGIDNGGLATGSATLLATQGAIKTYVDAQVTAQDLDVISDSGNIDIDLDSESLTLAGGTGLDTSATGTTVTWAIDSTVATLAGSQTLTNKTLTTPVISSISNTGTVTLPTSSDTLVGRATTDTLTNKTLSGSANTLSNIGNSSLSNSTVSYGGVSLALGASDATPAFNLSDATAYPGDSSLVTVGTITSGTWEGTTVAVAQGGTGKTSLTADRILLGDGTSAIKVASALSDGEVLIGDGSGAPTVLDVGSSSAITILGTVATGVWNGTAIANANLANSTVSYGGVSVALGASDATPAFNLSDATAYTGDSSLVTVGTITSGTWQGTGVDVAYGGTGITSYAAGDILYATGSTTLAKLAKGSDTQVLTLASGLPSWATPTVGDITGVTAGTGLSGGGTSGTVTLNVEASQTQITSVGTLGAGAISSGFGAIDIGSSQLDCGTVASGTWNGTVITGAYIDATSSPLANTKIWIGSASNVAAEFALSGDATMTAGGVVTVSTAAACTGNAATATALQTARTIGGVSFDGTGNINLPGVNTAGNQDTSGTAADATVLETARTIGGTSFNGSANIVPATITVADTTDTTSYVALFESATGDLGPKTDAGATYNAGTGVLTATAFAGPLTGNVTGDVSGSSGSTTGNAATATALQTARTIGGTSFDGTANIAVALSATATALATARAINGTDFDGTAAITVTAAAGTLTGATLASGVTASSLTSTGTLSSLNITNDLSVDSGTLFVDASEDTVCMGTTTAISNQKLHVVANEGEGAIPSPAQSIATFQRNVTAGNSAYVVVAGGSTSEVGLLFGDKDGVEVAGVKYHNNTSEMVFRVNNGNRVTIDSSGKMGIGTTDPDEALHVAESQYGLKVESTGGNKNPAILFEHSDGESEMWYTGVNLREDDANTFSLRYGGSVFALELASDGGVIMPVLPTSDPSVAGELWNSSGTVKISAG